MGETFTEYMVEYLTPGSGDDWGWCCSARTVEQAQAYIDAAPWPPESYRIMTRTVTVTPWVTLKPFHLNYAGADWPQTFETVEEAEEFARTWASVRPGTNAEDFSVMKGDETVVYYVPTDDEVYQQAAAAMQSRVESLACDQ